MSTHRSLLTSERWGAAANGAVAQTVAIAKKYGVIKKVPSGAVNYKYAARALAQLRASGTDIKGAKWKAAVVKVTPGGK